MPKALWNLAALVMMTTTVAAPNASAAGVSGEADSGATSLQDAGISEVIVTVARRSG